MLCCSQEGLKRIKLSHRDRVHLRKTENTTTSPFPVHVSIYNESDHPGHEQYDQLEGLKVTATISEQVIHDAVQHVRHSVQLKVLAPQLPRRLTDKMQKTLWDIIIDQSLAATDAVTCLLSALSVISEKLSDLLPELLTAAPECMEAYESIGPAGDTQRRIRFNDWDTASRVDFAGCSQTGDSPEQGGSSCGASFTPDYMTHAGMPHAVSKALKELAPRFPDLMMIPTASQSEGLTVSSASFTVSLLPSDPNWEHGALSICGTIAQVDSIQAWATPAKPRHSTDDVDSLALVQPNVGSNKTQACGHHRAREPVTAPQAHGQGLAVVLKLEPSDLLDVAACTMVNQMLRKQARMHAGMSSVRQICISSARVLFRLL